MVIHGSLEVNLYVALPSIANSPVGLDGVTGNLQVNVGEMCFCQGGRSLSFFGKVVKSVSSVPVEPATWFHLQRHIGQLVLEGLEAADGAAELLADLGIIYGHLHALASPAEGISSE